MSKPLVADDLWAALAPLLPPEPPKPRGGRPRCDDRAALAGIVFVLRSGIPWEMLVAHGGGVDEALSGALAEAGPAPADGARKCVRN